VTARDVIAQALALSEAASKAPWHHEPYGGQNQNGDYSGGHVFDADGEYVVPEVRDVDGALIAAARTLLPAFAKALGGVLDQHQQTTAYGVPVCDMCAQVKDADEWDDPSDDYSPVASWLPFPCPTVTAITAALSEVTP